MRHNPDIGRPVARSPSDVAPDTPDGVTDSATCIGKAPRQTIYLLEQKRLPAFKLSGRWHLRKSTYLTFLEGLERAAMPSSDSAPKGAVG